MGKNEPAVKLRMRFHFSNPDWAILLGAALMIFSALGWFIEAPRPEIERPPSLAMQVVPTLPAKMALPLADTTTPDPAGAGSFLVPVDIQPDQPEVTSPTAAAVPAAATPPASVTDAASQFDANADLPAPEVASTQIVLHVPGRIKIPAIQLDAPIFPSSYTLVQVDGLSFQQWEAPNSYAAGWQTSSVGLGVPGNTVLLGHNNINGEVFAHLVDLNEGDTIQVYTGDQIFKYRVEQKMILPEKGQDLSVRLQNANWLLPTDDERLTLVTCWPQSSNTHRLVIVARPEK